MDGTAIYPPIHDSECRLFFSLKASLIGFIDRVVDILFYTILYTRVGRSLLQWRSRVTADRTAGHGDRH